MEQGERSTVLKERYTMLKERSTKLTRVRVTYPTRCRIIDAEGHKPFEGSSLMASTPEESVPHIGKEGIAEREDDWMVKITLDDGHIIYGYECWWMPLDE